MLINPCITYVNTSSPFITMNNSNLDIYDIKPIDDYVFIFDIDDTLYKASEEMNNIEIEKWRKAYDFYLSDILNKEVPPFEDIIKCNPLLSETFYRLFNKSPIEVEHCKGSVDFSLYVNKDEKLVKLLKELPYRKFCFTNGMKCRAEPILQLMGLSDIFEGVICMDDKAKNNSVLGKPKKEAYDFVEDLLRIKDNSKVFFFDDAPVNIEEGLRRGWNSYLVKSDDNVVEMVNKILKTLNVDR